MRKKSLSSRQATTKHLDSRTKLVWSPSYNWSWFRNPHKTSKITRTGSVSTIVHNRKKPMWFKSPHNSTGKKTDALALIPLVLDTMFAACKKQKCTNSQRVSQNCASVGQRTKRTRTHTECGGPQVSVMLFHTKVRACVYRFAAAPCPTCAALTAKTKWPWGHMSFDGKQIQLWWAWTESSAETRSWVQLHCFLNLTRTILNLTKREYLRTVVAPGDPGPLRQPLPPTSSDSKPSEPRNRDVSLSGLMILVQKQQWVLRLRERGSLPFHCGERHTSAHWLNNNPLSVFALFSFPPNFQSSQETLIFLEKEKSKTFIVGSPLKFYTCRLRIG